MAKCKLCNNDRKLILHNPFYGVLAEESKHRVRLCKPCSMILDELSTKKYTGVYQSELWDGKVKNAIDAMLRPMRRVNYMVRFAGEVTANPESLAEHSYFVVLFATQIAKTVVKEPVDFEKLVSQAMFHDSPEIMVGDVPTPMKSGNIKEENDELEAKAMDIFKNKWGMWTGDIEQYDYTNLDNIESRIVKCADYMSAIVYCAEEVYIGSKNLENALMRSLGSFIKFSKHDWEKEIVKQTVEYVKSTLGWDELVAMLLTL